MTHNQIAYWGTQLQKEANVETARHNKAMEEQQKYATEVTKEYNARLASYNDRMAEIKAKESDRLAAYNDKMAAIKQAEAQEQVRHNMAYESITSAANWYSYDLGSQTLMSNNAFRAQELEYTGQRVANETREVGANIRRINVQNVATYSQMGTDQTRAYASLISARASQTQANTQARNVSNQYKLGTVNALITLLTTSAAYRAGKKALNSSN